VKKTSSTIKTRASRRAAPRCSAVEIAAGDIAKVEQALAPAVELMRLAHSSTMRASHDLGEAAGTGAAHACLGLMEVAMRSLHAANDAARYARHSLRYPPNIPLCVKDATKE